MPRLLFIGDIVGRPGRDVVAERLPRLREELQADFVVANGENAAAGAGITAAIAKELLGAGIDAITLGDHVWDQRGFDVEIPTLESVCRPANLPKICPGRTHLLIERNGFRLGIFTVLGAAFMKIPADNPFHHADTLMNELKGQCDAIVAEIHAEATSEKIAFGWYMDGRATLVVGTHTHVPTADEIVLLRGTAYITDVGMTGPYQSVLGREVQPVLARFLDSMPRKWDIASGDVRLCGCLVDFTKRGMATAIQRVDVRV
jgi:hypothetical protein